MAAALAGVGLVALSTLPAVAESDPPLNLADPEMTFESPSPVAGQVLSGVQKVQVKAAGDQFSTLEKFTVTIASNDPSVPPFAYTVPLDQPFDGKRDQRIQIVWDTGELTPRNGVYKLVAWGKACDFGKCSFDTSENTVAVEGIKVDNKPSVPQGVQATVQGTNPVVTWSDNPEADIKGYSIVRTVQDQPEPGKIVGTVPRTTSFTDPCTGGCPSGATLSYQVIAVRHSAVNPEGLVSAASNSASVVAPVIAPQAKPVGTTVNPAPGPAAPGRPAAPAAAGGSAPVQGPPLFYGDPGDYAPVLPYPELVPVQPPAPPSVLAEGAPAVPEVRAPAAPVAMLPDRLEPPRVAKVRYVAGALMLLVLAMHIARGGGLLMAYGPRERKVRRRR